MQTTPLGTQRAMMDQVGRAITARRLIDGQDDITLYVRGALCYDAVAYVIYMLGAHIPPNALVPTTAQAWLPTLDFDDGAVWMGAHIATGTAVGFERPATGIFHAALAIGGTRIRAVNGGLLGAGWLVPVDLRAVLVPGADGWCNFDGRQVRVRLSAA
jgi:hypothetical protein